MSLCSAGSFHLLHLMFDDYVMYLVENLYSDERAKDLLRAIKGQTSLGKKTRLQMFCMIYSYL